MTQDTEDVVARKLVTQEMIEAAVEEFPTPAEIGLEDTEAIRRMLLAAIEASDRQSLSDRIDVLEDSIVELWHESEAGRKELHEYLGMTWEEYQAWANPRAALHQEGIAP